MSDGPIALKMLAMGHLDRTPDRIAARLDHNAEGCWLYEGPGSVEHNVVMSANAPPMTAPLTLLDTGVTYIGWSDWSAARRRQSVPPGLGAASDAEDVSRIGARIVD